MSGLFCIANLWEVGRKKKIILFYELQPSTNQNEVKMLRQKCSYRKDIETGKRPIKLKTKVCNLTKTSKS